MTDEEKTAAELVAWGAYNESRGLDLSLAVYREVMVAKAAVAKPIVVVIHSPEGAARDGIDFARAIETTDDKETQTP